MVPSVKILALKVNFSVSTEVRMLASVLRCFPNIETLHVESAIADKPTGEHYAEFFEKLSPIECVWYQIIKKMVLHNFRGDISEIAFLKFITQRANELQKLTLVLPGEALLEVGQDQSSSSGRRPLSYLPVYAVTPDGTLSAIPSGEDDGEGRNCALPDELFHIVISHLPIKDVVRTTVLSPWWRGI
ncbi:hypothetical protein C2845_PM08G17850 [Panicum miliaceum]|uniref:Uncharacterized protein n=1 Tax=Panicum miliaceum TaxID=4540 RepID=A0A3L6R0L4_PANMI|nr:hypothetical protein C2845_PM08G17850 [Panicum miliaceum]